MSGYLIETETFNPAQPDDPATFVWPLAPFFDAKTLRKLTQYNNTHEKDLHLRCSSNPVVRKSTQKRHAELWPELKRQITESGVRNYSIYWDKDTNILFGYQEVEGDANSQDAEAADEITHKWWDFMADIMEVNPDNSPVTIPIKEVFHLD